MIKAQTISKIFLCAVGFVFAVVALYFINISSAQQLRPSIIFSWSTNTLVPPGHKVKAQPILNSSIWVSAEMIFENKLQKLSNSTFAWFVDNNIYKSGKGERVFNFKTKRGPGDAHLVRLEVTHNGQIYEKSVRIPIQKPTIIIGSPGPSDNVFSGGNIFRALPYYFNTTNFSDINLSWKVNGQEVKTAGTAEQDRLSLNVNDVTQDRQVYSLSLFAQNKADLTEFSTVSTQVEVKK